MSEKGKTAPALKVVLAFATVYVVWGSTYFFIARAIESFPPFVLGATRFLASGLIMLTWCIYVGEKVFDRTAIKHATLSGLLLLFIGNGAVIWVEQYLPSALVAIMVSSSPLWFVLLDKPKWSENLTGRSTLSGLLIGFVGVVALFYRSLVGAFTGTHQVEIGGMILVTLAAMAWAGGSLYSKYYAGGSSAVVNSTWQMLTAGLAFSLAAILRGEVTEFDVYSVDIEAWASLGYLVLFGSIAGYSAYVWLLEVRPATQVSTYAYVNPVVAVLLGVFFANEQISALQLGGLAIILISVMMINFAKYRKEKRASVSPSP